VAAPVAALLLTGVLSCDGEATDPDSGAELCTEVIRFLRGCQLLSEGEVSCRIFENTTYATCFRQCLDGATCDDVRAQTCDDVDNPFALCKDRCEFAAFSAIDCGDGTTVDLNDRCDGARDCANGADELRCNELMAMFDCGGGERVSADDQCDGTSDCANGKDEEGCPMRAMTICPGGF
jgi:hypothetical protein